MVTGVGAWLTGIGAAVFGTLGLARLQPETRSNKAVNVSTVRMVASFVTG
jgi:hypothetical protein